MKLVHRLGAIKYNDNHESSSILTLLVTPELLEKGIRFAMNRWLRQFVINFDELPKAFNYFKTWRFIDCPRDDIFEKGFKTEDFMDLAK
jgi:hypothetical protein